MAIGRRKAGGSGDQAAARNERLRRSREERNWTQADVARALGVSNLTISRWEVGVQQPVPYFREKLCALFERSARELGLLPDTPTTPVPRELPRPPADFTGRTDELTRLRELIDPPGRADEMRLVVGAIDGMAGTGKSALAIQVAHQLADGDAFPDGQLYVNLRGATVGLQPLEPVDALGRMLRSLGLDPAAIPADVEEAAARFRSLAAERRMMVLLDDARSAEQVRPLLPASPTCVVLITSRQMLASLEGVRSLHLDVLSHEEALRLLGLIAGRERVAVEARAAAELVHWCGRLPLAIRIAGARLAARPTWSIGDLAGALADATRRLEALQVGEVTVRASFDVSLQALQDSPDPVDRAAAAAFGLLSLPDGPDVGVETAARLLDQPAPAVHAVLERLVDAQLLETLRPGRYRFHDLVRVYARAHVADQHPEPVRTAALTRAIGFAIGTTWQAAAILPSGAWHLTTADARWTGGGLGFRDAPEALGWLEAERANLMAASAQAAADALGRRPTLPSELTGQLAAALYSFFEVRSYWHDQAHVNQAALEVARHTGDLAGEAAALNDLGMAHDRLGHDEEGGVCLRGGLAIFRRLGDRRGEATSLLHLSLNQAWQGRYTEAMAGQRESLAIFREIGDRSGQADSLRTLASIHGRLAQYGEATECLRECLAISRELGDRLSEAAALTNLGIVSRHLGRLDEAVSHLRSSLSIFRAFDHRGQANSLHDLGVAYAQMGRHEQALECLREALLLFGELGNRRGQAVALRDLGDAFQAIGRDTESREAWSEGLAISEALRIPAADEIRRRLTAPGARLGRSGGAG
jgi:tetratricopeptide (TPR) repeat protein/transcriptional regulator with XRE-family HTH domain